MKIILYFLSEANKNVAIFNLKAHFLDACGAHFDLQ